MADASGAFEISGPEYRRPDQRQQVQGGTFEITGPEYRRPGAPAPEAPMPLPPQPPGPFEQRVQEYMPQMQQSERQRGYRLPSAEIPIITPLAERGAAAIAAATGAGTGEGFGDRYSDLLARTQARKRAYEQANPISSMVGEAGGFAGGLATTPILGIGQRAAGLLRPILGAGAEGALYGGAEEAAKIAPDETLSEKANRIASGALMSGIFGAGVRGAIPLAEQVLRGARGVYSYMQPAATRAEGSVRAGAEGAYPRVRGLTPEEFNRLEAQGYPVNIADVKGVRPTVEQAMGRQPELGRSFAQQLDERGRAAAFETQGVLDSLIESRVAANRPASMANEPINLDPAYLREVSSAAYAQETEPLYRAAFNSAPAQNVWPSLPPSSSSPNPLNLDWFINQPASRRAISEASDLLNMKYPDMLQYGKLGPFEELNDHLALRPDQNVSLEFWDMVKRRLDHQVNEARAKGDSNLFVSLRNFRDAFRDGLKEAVPGYDAATKTAQKFITGENAFTAGFNFVPALSRFESSRRGASSALVEDISKQMRALTRDFSPIQRQEFATGAMSFIRSDPDKAAAAIVNSQGPTRRMYEAILGQDFPQVFDAMLYHNTVKMTGMLQAQAPSTTHLSQQLGAGFASWLFQLPVIKQMFAHGAVGIHNIKEQGKAREIMELAANPDSHRDLFRKIQSSPDYRSTAEIMQPYLTRAFSVLTEPPEAGLAEPLSAAQGVIQQALQPRRAGGRVGRASGGRLMRNDHAARAAALIKAAEAAKKAHNATTEGILEQPDEAVAEALSIANKAI